MDHLISEHKVGSGSIPGYWRHRCWHLGLSVFTKRNQVASTTGTHGWNGGFGTFWYADPAEDLIGILTIQ